MLYFLYVLILLTALVSFIMPETQKANKLFQWSNVIINFLILFIIIGSATFNNDWIAYTNLFDGIVPVMRVRSLAAWVFGVVR